AAPTRLTAVERPTVIRSAVHRRSTPVVSTPVVTLKEPASEAAAANVTVATTKPLEASSVLALPTPCRQGGRARSKDKEEVHVQQRRRCSRCGFEEPASG
ncbi:unnamed protein product, partial [Symbiodinium pilosum]